MSLPIYLAILLFALLAVYTSTAHAQEIAPAEADLAAISPQLGQEFAQATEPVTFLAILDDQPNLDGFSAPGLNASDRQTKAVALYAYLTDHATQSQAPLRAWLDEQGIQYRPFYLVNMVEIQGDAETAQKLRRRPEVNRLAANPEVAQLNSTQHADSGLSWATALDDVDAPASTDLPYGLSFTNAPDVWDLGYTGQGIVVAGQDTGVHWTHPALQEKYRGWSVAGPTDHVYNWYDAWNTNSFFDLCQQDPQIPCDDHGHGTHTMGTMIGDATADGRSVIGMAPGAAWIGCRNMLNGVGTPASYTACFEFFLAPYPQNGSPFSDGRPELAPHVINNSWSCPPFEGCDLDSLRQVVETVRAAGIFVVSSAGNSGSACETVLDPIAIYDASFSIGAHNSAGTIASFSSRGPVAVDGSGRRKPDLTAPGVGVLSAWPNTAYISIQGTSMAAPHVAGAAALLWSAAPSLLGNIDLTEQVLVKSATPMLDSTCDGATAPSSPNNTYGYGHLNILAAVQLGQAPSSASVTVRDCDGATLPGALVTFEDSVTDYAYTQLTNISGTVQFPAIYTMAVSETYTLAATAGTAHLTATAETLQRGENSVFDIQATVCNVPATANVTVVDLLNVPVKQAQVTLRDVQTQNLYAGMTDEDGKISFPNIYAGEYVVDVSAPDQKFASKTFQVDGGGTAEVNIKGIPLVYKLFAPFMIR